MLNKKRSILRYLPVILTAISASLAQAGNGSSGGGDVAVLPGSGDDRVVLADSFIKLPEPVTEVGTPVALSQSLKNELSRAEKIFDTLEHWPHPTPVSIFIDTNILSPDIKYYFVEKIPDREECNNRMTYENLPKGTLIEQVACTIENVTWLQKDLFSKLSVRSQAALLIHEGFRRLSLSPNDYTIAQICSSLEVALGILNDQLSGRMTALSPGQLSSLNSLRKSLKNAKLISDDSNSLNFIANGGALVNSDVVVPVNTYIALTVRIEKNVRLKEAATYMSYDAIQAEQKTGSDPVTARSISRDAVLVCLAEAYNKANWILGTDIDYHDIDISKSFTWYLQDEAARQLKNIQENCINKKLAKYQIEPIFFANTQYENWGKYCDNYYRHDKLDEAKQCYQETSVEDYIEVLAEKIVSLQTKP